MIKLKWIVAISIFMSILWISQKIEAKYISEEQKIIGVLKIEHIKPKVELEKIENTNWNYEKYANKNHTIKIKINVLEKNLKQDAMAEEQVVIKIKENKVIPQVLKVKKIEEIVGKITYEIEIKGIQEEGLLTIEIKEGTWINISDLKNDCYLLQTGIIVDNTPPQLTFREEKIAEGKVNGVILANEKIRENNGWKLQENQMCMIQEFANNVYYDIPVIDQAENTSPIRVEIKTATYIKLVYGSHNSIKGWSFGHGNYDIAGKEAVLANPLYKTEALAFHVDGNIPKDFVQAKAYIYNHWGEGSEAICTSSHLKYSYGYNPKDNTWKSMNTNELVEINQKKYFQLGGAGMNKLKQTDINGQGEITTQLSQEYRYGISGICLKLKEQSYYSIVYQTLVNEVGWLPPQADGKECVYQKNKPISAVRVALIPKTEKEYLVKQWEKDIGTKNVETKN